jgi:hypothetical protein
LISNPSADFKVNNWNLLICSGVVNTLIFVTP